MINARRQCRFFNNRYWCLALVPILLFLVVASCFAEEPKQTKIGVVVALTGAVSVEGVPLKNAMLLAKEELDTEGRLKLIFEDDGFLPRNALSAAIKLMRQDRVDALIVFGTNQGLGIVDLTEKAKLPFLSINVNRSVVRGREHAVLLMPSVEALTAVNVSEARKRNYKTVATVATQQDSCLLQRDIFVKSGVAEIIKSEEFVPSEREFRESAFRIARANPDAVFLSTLPPQASLFSKKLRELGFKGDFFGSIQASNLSELRASSGALEGAWIVAGDERSGERLFAAYRQRFNSEPTAMSVYGYDAIKLILEGLKSDDLNDYLHNVKNFDGEAGRYSSDGENGYSFKVVAKEFTSTGYRYLDSK